MTPFIQRPDDPEIPPPYTFPGVTINSFELEADIEALQDLCDKFLNIGDIHQRGFEYRPLLPYVALEVLYYPKLISLQPPYSYWGYISQNEAYIRFPVVKYDLLFGLFMVPVEVSNFFPFLFVDSSWSAFSGREVIGFPKVIGDIVQATSPDRSYSASVQAPVFPTYSPSTIQALRQVVRVNTGPPLEAPREASSAPPTMWPWAITSLEGVAGAVESAIIEVAELIDRDLLSTVQLKQIRDAQDPTMACFQGLVHSDFQVHNVSLPELFSDPEIVLTRSASLDLARSCGLPASPIPAVLAYRTTCDMTFGNTTNLFITSGLGRSPVEGGGLLPLLRYFWGA